MNPLVSIITIVLNQSNMIDNTLKSSINQTYKNKEIIVIDGCSTDGTLDTINKYRNYLSFIISEKDNGIYDAMNKGIKQATGEWIIFMNSSDCFANDNVLSEVFSNNYYLNINLIYGGFILNDIYNKPLTMSIKSLCYGMPTTHQSMFFKNIEIYYDTNYKLASDYDYVWRYFNIDHIKITLINIPISIIDNRGESYINRGINSREYLSIAKIYSPSIIIYINYMLRNISNEISIKFFILYKFLKLFTSRNRT